ncbi:MAG TPA: ABC transporter ATP-binding protein [Polyangiaceae bacterium]|nr:ABC transporter ATP-binding protein [Polyangiaceae bacterium]
MSVLSLQDIQRSFGKARALSGVSLNVQQGEVVGLIGRNGAGKSTLLNVALGLLHADRGSVRVFGLDPRQHPVEVKRRVGLVPEDESVFVNASIQRLFELHAALYPSWDEALAMRLLGPLAQDRSARLDGLSKGQARRVLLTCAMAHRPELLLLDEPAGGLDPSARREFLELAIELLNDAGSTILFSSHHMGDIERIAGRVVVLDQGQKLLDEELDALKENYSVAPLPALTPDQLAALERVPGFLRARPRGEALHAVFACEPEAAAAALVQHLGIANVRCARVNLEELFIHLVGGQA